MNQSINQAIHTIVEKLDQNIINIFPIIGNGSVNQVFIVTTDKRKLVVRLNKDRGLDEFIKEKWCIEQTTVKGVRGPHVIELGEINGYSYMIESFLEGMLSTQEAVDTLTIWKDIGKYARVIHNIPVPGFGLDSSELMNTTVNTSNKKLRKYITYNIENLTPEDKLLELNVLTTNQSRNVKSIFEELLKRQFIFGLNHGDLSLKNVIIDKENKVSLFDWGSAEAAVVPHHDFGEILKSSLKSNSDAFRSFLDGYGLSQDDYQHVEEDIHSLMLLRSIDKLRWAIDQQVDLFLFIKTVKEMYQLKFA